MNCILEKWPLYWQISTKLLQEGRHEDLDWVMRQKEEEHRRELEACEAEFDSEEAEHMKEISASLDSDLIDQVKQSHKEMIDKVGGFPIRISCW